MSKRICNKCNKNKVGLFAYWYGLRHCEECDLKPLNDYIVHRKKELKILNAELTTKENFLEEKRKELDKLELSIGAVEK